ncbi:MAG: ABC transporter substrate-binding protein [Marinosulfonomonas sp.]|nr:ABC transporter substrate-binding protein [Marinosulfonomonas sp.]
MFKKMTSTILAAATGITLAMAGSAFAIEKVKVVVGGGAPFWDTNMFALADQSGRFTEAGIEVELLSARGGGDILRVLLASEADLVAGVGILGVLAANEAGAPIKIIGNEMNTPHDLRWYVKGDSPINNLMDMAGKTLAYSSPGSSTNMVGLSLRQTLIDAGLEPLELVSTGGFSDTMTAILSGQVDAGFTALPFLHDKVLKGEIKYAIKGSDAAGFEGVTTRAYVANTKFLEERRDVAVTVMRIIQETIDLSLIHI